MNNTFIDSDVHEREPGATGLSHPLDSAIWQALTTQQAALAEGNERALRFPTHLAPFGAIRDTSLASFQSLADLLLPGESVALFTTRVLPDVDILATVREGSVEQMIWAADANVGDIKALVGAVTLYDADVEDMLALVGLTQPGPFSRGTASMGNFIGIRTGGKLVAMAGERMRLNGFTEISAVCVHPEFRGKGLAEYLIRTIAEKILKRGETPFLHVFSDNLPALSLYKKLGFSIRRKFYLRVLQRSTAA